MSTSADITSRFHSDPFPRSASCLLDNEEIKRRTRVVRIFPNPASRLRLIRALCAETHEGWFEDHRCRNMDFLKEQKKHLLQTAA